MLHNTDKKLPLLIILKATLACGLSNTDKWMDISTCFDDSYFFLPPKENWIITNLPSDDDFKVGL